LSASKKTTSIGLRGELLVTEKLISLGWSVSIPVGQQTVYDFIIQKGKNLHKVQVKSTESLSNSSKSNTPVFQFSCKHGKSHISYSKADIDFFIFCALDCIKFWILPIAAVKGTTIKIYTGSICKYTSYENAWTLFET
jgi:hypothetical protein